VVRLIDAYTLIRQAKAVASPSHSKAPYEAIVVRQNQKTPRGARPGVAARLYDSVTRCYQARLL